MPTYHNYIDGSWVPSTSGELFENRNPANRDDLIGLFAKSNERDVADAVDAARRAYLRWRLVPAPRRAEILFRAAQLFAEHKEALARDMTREMGKVLAETRGDVQEAVDMTFFMAGEGRRQYGQTVPSELRDKFAMSVRQPLGVCAVITDRKSTRLNSSHVEISYAVFCLKKKKKPEKVGEEVAQQDMRS